MKSFLLVLFSALAIAMPFSAPAGAAQDRAAAPAAPRNVAQGWQLAQASDVDVFFDARGRRVLLDRRTGELIAIEEPNRAPRGESWRERLEDAGVLSATPGTVGDPAAIERYRRYRESQLGLREPPTSQELLDAYPLPRDEAYPDRGGMPSRYPDREQTIAREEPIGRQPLSDNPVTGSTPPVTAPPVTTLPGATGAPVVTTRGPSENVAKLQILLDRKGVSPGVIDGHMGGNVEKALDAYREMTGSRLATTDTALIDSMLEESGGPAFTVYTISPEDAAGPYIASVPADYGEKAQLDRMSFTSVAEMLAERFHMDEAYLKAINPGADFNRPGTQIKVAVPGAIKTGQVASIIADKGREQVRAYDAEGRLVVAYPATIGSTDTPSPSGTVTVERIAFDPEYTYNPKINFKQGNNDRVLRIPPGPNGPVGTIWIALSKPTYGIHGTPEPSKIGKTNSHGCIRLTNWDAFELAKMVKQGVTVEFVE